MSEQSAAAGARQNENGGAEYEEYYFQHDCGVPYERNDHWLSFFGRVADGIVRDLNPTSVLDAGCAMGFLVEMLQERGVEAWGVDISEYAISQVDESVRDRCRVASLTEALPRRYDLIVCIEVLEHLEPAEADTAIANLCAATDRLLLSTSPTNYGEATHLNVQPPETWSALLAREGFFREVERDASYVTPWAAVFSRTEEPPAETVRRYDRSWWRLRQEVGELRKALLTAQERLAEVEKAETERPKLQRELDEGKEEILRLRDLLIAKDAELGLAKGRAEELNEHSARLALAVRNVQSRFPTLKKVAAGFLRRG